MKKNVSFYLILIAVGTILGIGAFFGIKNITQKALNPIYEANENLKTQVSKLLNPTPTIIPDPVTIINEVNTLARLETIQYSMEKIITAEVGQEVFGRLFGDRLLFVAYGDVIAGIDLAKLKIDDIEIRNGQLFVTLPEAEIFIIDLDNEKSYVYDRETGLFTKGDRNLETQARQAAEAEILTTAIENGILEQAQINGEAYLRGFLNNLGFDSVIFLQPEATMTPTIVPTASTNS